MWEENNEYDTYSNWTGCEKKGRVELGIIRYGSVNVSDACCDEGLQGYLLCA